MKSPPSTTRIVIAVVPVGAFWVMRAPALGADLFYLDRDRAVMAARRVAWRLVAAGHAVQLDLKPGDTGAPPWSDGSPPGLPQPWAGSLGLEDARPAVSAG